MEMLQASLSNVVFDYLLRTFLMASIKLYRNFYLHLCW